MDTKHYQVELTEAEKDFVIFAIQDCTDYLVDKIRDGELMESEDNHVQGLINNIMTNAQEEIDRLKKKIEELTAAKEETVPVAVHHSVKKKGLPAAPYGLKKDGTPKKRPGRPAKGEK